MLGAIGRKYKLFWQVCNKGTAGVFIAEMLRDGLTGLSMCSESMSGSCM